MKTLIKPETAFLAKEVKYLDSKSPIGDAYFKLGEGKYELGHFSVIYDLNSPDEYFSKENVARACEQHSLRNWLDQTHMLRVDPQHNDAVGNYKVTIWEALFDNNIGKWKRHGIIQAYESYEEAFEAGLYKALLILKDLKAEHEKLLFSLREQTFHHDDESVKSVVNDYLAKHPQMLRFGNKEWYYKYC